MRADQKTLAQRIGGNAALPYVPTDLERSHDELRGALIGVGRYLLKKNCGRKERAMVRKLRMVIKEARLVRHPERVNYARGASSQG